MFTAHPSAPGVFVIDPDADPVVDRRCPVLIPISKNIEGKIAISAKPNVPCPCKCPGVVPDEIIETASHDFCATLRFDSNWPCDDVHRARLLDGCRMLVEGDMKLRDRKCRHSDVADETGDHHLILGCQQGRFLIYRPIDPDDHSAGFVPVFEGQLNGTIGFDPGQKEGSRCCAEDHTRGMMVGRGLGPLRDCEICVTYEGHFKSLDNSDLCADRTIGWVFNLDGTVCCRCPDWKEEEREKT